MKVQNVDQLNRKLLYERYVWFKKHGACIVGHHAEVGLKLARAWEWLQGQVAAGNIEVTWEPDYDSDGPHEWGWSENELKRWNRSEHECLYCALRTPDGDRILASLGGTWDASREYQKVIEAELALEAMHEWEERERQVRYANEYGEIWDGGPLEQGAYHV